MQRYYLTVYKCRPAVCKIGALMFKIVIRTKKAAFAPRVFMRVSGGQKYVGHNSKYVRHILKYLRHNFYLLPEECNGVKMSFRFPWLKNGVSRPGFCGCECPPCRVAAGLPEKVRIKNACPANVAGTHYNISPALGRVSLSCWRISLWRAPRWLPQSCP